MIMGSRLLLQLVWDILSTLFGNGLLEIDPVIGEAQGVLIGLIDRIRMLDNDLIRLNQKLNVVLTLKEQQEINENKIAELREIIKEAGLSEDDNEKLHSLEDLKKIYKEEQNK